MLLETTRQELKPSAGSEGQKNPWALKLVGLPLALGIASIVSYLAVFAFMLADHRMLSTQPLTYNGEFATLMLGAVVVAGTISITFIVVAMSKKYHGYKF